VVINRVMPFPSLSLDLNTASTGSNCFSEAEAFRSFEDRTAFRIPGMAIAAMIAITIINSIRVKPRRRILVMIIKHSASKETGTAPPPTTRTFRTCTGRGAE
jgi:hypothetical protein